MIVQALLFTGTVMLAAPAGARPTYAAFKDAAAVMQGRGDGTMKVSRGIDWWFSGEPARKFQRVGAITDIRTENGREDDVFGSSDVANLVTGKGGTAVIVLGQERKTVASAPVFNTFGGGAGYGNTVVSPPPGEQITTTLAVIKYVEQ